MAHCRFQQRLRGGFTVFFLEIFFQRTGVYPDTDRDVFIASAVHHHADTLFVADIARVYAQAINAYSRYLQGNAVIEVDIGNQRYANLLFDKLERFRPSIVGTWKRARYPRQRAQGL
ncbi:Uncharacterised protein [Klebsiella michiganensis]|nr:Uncharacterised protein [Klebsiella michiganensis]